jgi:16S rRNA (cytidine1402-2'-O)-methyltransferase
MAKDKLNSQFYIVSTPIGNFDDITIRALGVLKSVDTILCEDTRVTSKLLAHFGISTQLVVYNDFSTEKDRSKIMKMLHAGNRLALVSDAGTPLISDPGYKLIIFLRDNHIKITAVPGASSVITALTLSCQPTDRFLFVGFLPAKQIARIKFLQEFIHSTCTVVMFDTAQRMLESFDDMITVYGTKREISIIREATKTHEEIKIGSISTVKEYYEHGDGITKGEIVIVLSPAPLPDLESDDELDETLGELLKNMSLKDAVNMLHQHSKHSKKYIYKKAVQIISNT